MRYSASLSALALAACLSARAAEGELDQFEDKCVTRGAERALRAAKSDRALWLKELEAAFPGKVISATTEEEYATWFDLLAGKNEEWKRDDTPNPQLTQLFDKLIQRMELGPVPSVKREEFKKYARKVLREGNPPHDGAKDENDEADKAFRALDRNGDGELEAAEQTTGLKDEKGRFDADSNGRISKEEYRDYFRKKVAVKVEVLAAAKSGGDPLVRPSDSKTLAKPGAKPGPVVPDWFTTLDADKDGQISLFEWRDGNKPADLFKEMDLDGDGLLTKDEYLRWVKLKEIDLNQRRREGERP